jgi:predicted dehydrogenase
VSQRKRCLMIGAGGHAAGWIRELLPQFADRVELAGLVDVSELALAESGDFLSLPNARRFTEMDRAFDAVEADLCVVSIPAAFHRQAVLAAAQHGVPILCEKPLADTWEACRDIYRAVTGSGVKMEVVQNYRYNAPMLAIKQVLRSGQLGRLNYIVARFLDDCREYDSWARRHELQHAMLIDGAAHHLDMLRNLSGADCETIAALEWNPAWSTSTGEFCALSMLSMNDGTRATYEGNATAAGEQNPWHQESYRAECEAGSVTVDGEGTVRVHRHTRGGGLVSEEVALPRRPREGHEWVVGEFLDWLDDRPTPTTTLDDNIRSAAAIFGAIESAHTGQVVNVARMVEEL